mmetsp:Transcript_4739/g.8447  ORF Transcript_4739/g.8447 Transcript_4739/m.8447 type:complete len:102 (-) Transcript_4739:133-438(-)
MPVRSSRRLWIFSLERSRLELASATRRRASSMLELMDAYLSRSDIAPGRELAMVVILQSLKMSSMKMQGHGSLGGTGRGNEGVFVAKLVDAEFDKKTRQTN